MPSASAADRQSRLMILLLGLLSASAPLAIDMYLPAFPAIAQQLDIPISGVQQTLSVFMLGFAGCQLFYGPLSDSIGRKPVILGGLLLFLLASLGCAFAETLQQLLGWRLLQALGAGASSVVVIAVVRDLYEAEQAARTLSLVMISMTLAPLLAPILGAQLLLVFGWHAIFVCLAAIALIQLLLVLRKLPETLAPQQRREFSIAALLRGYGAVLCHRQAMANLLSSSFSLAGMFAFLAGSPFVYIEYFGVPAQYYGLLFGSNILVMIGLNWLNSRLITEVGLERMIRFATGMQCLSGLALLAAVLSGVGGLWSVAPGIILYVGMIGLVGANTSAGAVSPFKQSAGTASALLGASRFMLGALAAAMVGWLHDGTPLPMAAVICTCGVLTFASYRLLNGRAPAADRAAGA